MRCRILSMAYRNHPTRYLIVKDRVASPAVAGGQQEAATYAARVPVSSTFFSKPADSFVGGRASGFPKRRAYLRVPVRPVKHFFFNHRFAPLGDPAALPFCRAEEASTLARPARQHFFFTQPEEPLSLGPRRRFTSARRSVSTLAHPARQRFFSIPPRFLATPGRARRGFPQRGLLGLLASPPDCQPPFTYLP